MKLIKSLFSLFWNEGPKIYFWWSILGLNVLVVKFKNPYIYWPVAIIAIFSLGIIFIKIYSSIKAQLNEVRISSNIKEVSVSGDDFTKVLISNLPSERFCQLIYSYGEDLAKNWSSDGELKEINFYLNYDGKKISKNVQMFVYSKTRQEELMKILPHSTEKISLDKTLLPQQERVSRKIYKFPKWRIALQRIVELASSEIDKAQSVRFQIVPSYDEIHANFYLGKGNREWVVKYKYKEKHIYDKDNKILVILNEK